MELVTCTGVDDVSGTDTDAAVESVEMWN